MYSPAIAQDQVGRLYQLRQKLKETGIRKPMTVLVKEAIEEYLKGRQETVEAQ